MMNPIFRIARLVAIEWIKIRSQILFFVAILLIVGASLGAAWFKEFSTRKVAESKKAVATEMHSLQLFSAGAKQGLKMAAFFMVIFGALMFSTEFDRGTIKNLLTRPVTRTDFYVAKGLASLLLAALFAGLALYVSLLYGSLKGQMGEVWSDLGTYPVALRMDDLQAYAWQAMGMCLPSLLAAMFFGLFISSLFDSTGIAVAMALILFLVADIALGFFEGGGRYFFNFYPDYALDLLRQKSEGVGVNWDSSVNMPYIKIPFIYVAGFATLSYLRIRLRDVTG